VSEIFNVQVLALTWPEMTTVPSADWAWAEINASVIEVAMAIFCFVKFLIMRKLLERKS
jgi:hypothetical protein